MKRLFAPGSHMYPLERPEATAELVQGILDDLLGADHREGGHD
ncbi:hypothetical protein ASALC70_04296 [Alcanivorax sp. ALC70]|nr:hypothetical protein ASALC70_04296 [Alcanivorax sp. ALC70]